MPLFQVLWRSESTLGLYVPAAYFSSLYLCRSLVDGILGHSPLTPSVLPHYISALAVAAARPEWSSPQDLNVPLHQCALSKIIILSMAFT